MRLPQRYRFSVDFVKADTTRALNADTDGCTACPECGAAKIRRQLTAPQFRLAGGGWYETDFKKDGDKKRNLADKGGAENGGTSSGSEPAKSDTAKSEAKIDAKPAAPSTPAA